MRRIVLVLAGLLVGAGALQAQGEDPRGENLRAAIQERFARQVQDQLGLTDSQAEKMRTTALEWFGKRRALEVQERRLRAALGSQMRPGIPADQDSVARLTDALLTLKVAQVQTYRDEIREMTYLTPLQRAQFFMLRDRLLRRIEEVQQGPEAPLVRQRRRP